MSANFPPPPQEREFNSPQWQTWFYAIYRAFHPQARRSMATATAETVRVGHSVHTPNVYRPVKQVSTSYEMVADDCVLFVDATAGDVDITLPPASGGRAGHTSRRTIKRVDSAVNVANILVRSTDELDNGAAVTVAADQAKDFDCDGSTKWYTVGAT